MMWQFLSSTPTTPTMASLLADLSTVVTQVFTWVVTVASTITTTPLLLLTTGFLVLGGAIGIFGRLLFGRVFDVSCYTRFIYVCVSSLV